MNKGLFFPPSEKLHLCIFQERRKWKRALPEGRGDEGEAEEVQIAGAAGAVAASALGVWGAAHGREHPAPVPHGQCLRAPCHGQLGAKCHWDCIVSNLFVMEHHQLRRGAALQLFSHTKGEEFPTLLCRESSPPVLICQGLLESVASVSTTSQQPESPTWFFITFPLKSEIFLLSAESCLVCPRQLYSSLLWIGFEDCGLNNSFVLLIKGLWNDPDFSQSLTVAWRTGLLLLLRRFISIPALRDENEMSFRITPKPTHSLILWQAVLLHPCTDFAEHKVRWEDQRRREAAEPPQIHHNDLFGLMPVTKLFCQYKSWKTSQPYRFGAGPFRFLL